MQGLNPKHIHHYTISQQLSVTVTTGLPIVNTACLYMCIRTYVHTYIYVQACAVCRFHPSCSRGEVCCLCALTVYQTVPA